MLFGEFAKSAAEAAYPELWQGLVGAWSPCLNPRGGTTLYDWSGRANHGTLTNMDPATDWVLSGGRPALDFVTDDFVSIPNASWLHILGDITIESWLTVRSVSGFPYIVNRSGSASSLHYLLGVNDNRIRFYSRGTEVSVSSAGYTGSLLHVVATVTGSRMDLYANGKAVATGTRTGTQEYNGTVEIGVVPWVGSYIDAVIHEVLTYNQSTSASTVSQKFRLGPGGWAERRRKRRVASVDVTNRRRRLLFSAR